MEVAARDRLPALEDEGVVGGAVPLHIEYCAHVCEGFGHRPKHLGRTSQGVSVLDLGAVCVGATILLSTSSALRLRATIGCPSCDRASERISLNEETVPRSASTDLATATMCCVPLIRARPAQPPLTGMNL